MTFHRYGLNKFKIMWTLHWWPYSSTLVSGSTDDQSISRVQAVHFLFMTWKLYWLVRAPVVYQNLPITETKERFETKSLITTMGLNSKKNEIIVFIIELLQVFTDQIKLIEKKKFKKHVLNRKRVTFHHWSGETQSVWSDTHRLYGLSRFLMAYDRVFWKAGADSMLQFPQPETKRVCPHPAATMAIVWGHVTYVRTNTLQRAMII